MRRIGLLSIAIVGACGDAPTEPFAAGAPRPALEVLTGSLPDGREGRAYQASITADGGTNEGFRWTVDDGRLPPGVVLEAAGTPQTRLTGMPATAGQYSFRIRVTDSAGETAEQALSVSVEPAGPPVVLLNRELPVAFLDVPYSASVGTLDGSGQAYRWAVIDGRLPAGVTLLPEGGAARLNGLPAERGTFTFTVRVEDLTWNDRDERTFTIEVVPVPPLSIAFYDESDEWDFEAVGGCAPISWAIVSGDGRLVTDGRLARVILPLEPGRYGYRLQAEDCSGQVGERSVVTSIDNPRPPVRILTVFVPSGVVGVTYEANIEAVNGVSPHVWSIAMGPLPPGLALERSAGPQTRIMGTPTQAGEFTFEVRVLDDLGRTHAFVYTLPVTDE